MIHESPLGSIVVPDLSFHDLVLYGSPRDRGKLALVDGPSGRSITYGQLPGLVQKVAAGLAKMGIGKGDVIAIDSPNLPEYAVAVLAASTRGAAVTTASPLFTADELKKQLEDSGASLLLTIPQLMDKARAAVVGTRVRGIVVFGEAPGATPFASLLATEEEVPPVAIDSARDLLLLPYSSGTTGLPKGVMLTHRNVVANILQTETVEQIDPDDVVIGVLPFFHIYGMTVVLAMMLASGATVVTLPRFELAQFLETCQRYRVTRAFVVPPIILALAKHPLVDSYDLSALRWVNSGAAPLSGELARACAERLGCVVRQGYGLTETSPVTHFVPPDQAGRKLASVGPSIPGTEVMITELGTGRPLGPGEEGEVWIRGPQVMRGYLGQPEATARMLDSEGWLHTGDIGFADEEGWLFVVDRAKELIKYKGFQVAPAELEAVLLQHPGIADAAVIGVADEEAGEVPKAFVVAREPLTEEGVMAWVAERVAPYKKVRRVAFREAIPKSPSGKILRRVLVAEERAAVPLPLEA